MKKMIARWIMFLAVMASFSLAQVPGGDQPLFSDQVPVAASPSPAAASFSMRTPLILGASICFGSGTGVGSERGLGLRQIEPIIGIWLPGMGFIRAGYGFYDYDEHADNREDYTVEHSDFDVELAFNLLGDLYVIGSYSRVKELSDLGDVAWNEWGTGFGSMLSMFSRTIFFAELEYRWVLTHYDPFADKSVNGSRLQFNLGFAAYVF
ncbi:MAG: hypothetical protein HUK20_13520 [Fibrobacter sp.]|nr:hypothetical protein [Fibrobacter sp.]